MRKQEESPSVMPIILILLLAVGVPLVCIAGTIVTVVIVAVSAAREAADNLAAMPNQAPPAEKAAAGEALVPNAAPQPQRPAVADGKPVIDLIPLIDPVRDTVHGRWAVAMNVLHCNDMHLVPRIQIPYRPPEEYDFIVTFSQSSLRNGISLIMPNPRGGAFFWAIGFGTGTEYCFHGDPDKGGRIEGLIQPNKTYTTTVQVRRDGVTGLLDGKVLLRHKTDFRDLTCDEWREMRDTTILGVACDDPTVFHYVQVVEITGKGKKLR
jgi:hypothetical protein